MAFNKIKQKMLESSDSYNYYKDNYKKIKNIEKTLNSYNQLFNTIFLNFTLTPTPFLQNIRDLGYESLIFIDNVCKKYDLEWWFDGGTLLGAVRHGDYIPWDDDLDIGMMRKDYDKLVDVIQDEIKNNNLTNVTATFKKQTYKKLPNYRWIQIHYKHPNHNVTLLGLDIFPFDYIKDYHGQDIEETYQKSRDIFYREMYEGIEYEKILNNYYEMVNLNLEREDYYIPGVEGTHGPINLYDLVVMETDKLFPLKRIPFGRDKFPVPNDCDDYLKAIYGNSYLKIPKNVRTHGRTNKLREIENIMELFDEAIKTFREANKNFE